MFSISRNIGQNPNQVYVKGIMPVPTGVNDRQFSFAMDRSLIVRGWNGRLAARITNNNNVPATPFRAVLNASELSTCNNKYVFDSSAYASYKRQVAKKHTFNTLK